MVQLREMAAALHSSTPRRYKLLGILGQGGQGTVYLAETQGALRQRVAIKVLRADWSRDAALVARLKDEARLLAMLDHAAFVHVRDLEELDGAWSIVMEHVDGCDVRQLLRTGPIPVRPALGIAARVADALYVAHTLTGSDGKPLGLVHRDIKPSNLRVRRTGDVKILDFGVARANIDRSSDTTQGTYGTLAYMAPERFHKQDPHESDVYALGVTLFAMLVGVTPGDAHWHPDRRPPGDALRDQWAWIRSVDPALHTLLATMLDPDPTRRPTGRAVAEALDDIAARVRGPKLGAWAETHVVPEVAGPTAEPEAWLTGTLPQPRRAPTPSRWPWVLAAASIVAVATVVCTAGGVWLGTRGGADPAPPVPSAAPTEPVAAPTAEPVVPPAAAPVPAPTPTPRPAPTASVSKATTPAPAPTASTERPAPAIAAPAPPTAPAAPATGTLRVTGDVAEVSITGPNGRASPGALPAGTYTVRVRLNSGVEPAELSVSLASGATVEIACRDEFRTCRVRR